jgi:hypothetical protein
LVSSVHFSIQAVLSDLRDFHELIMFWSIFFHNVKYDRAKICSVNSSSVRAVTPVVILCRALLGDFASAIHILFVCFARTKYSWWLHVCVLARFQSGKKDYISIYKYGSESEFDGIVVFCIVVWMTDHTATNGILSVPYWAQLLVSRLKHQNRRVKNKNRKNWQWNTRTVEWETRTVEWKPRTAEWKREP